MNNSKTFRLFISSTFSDFKKEREVLQTEVFPTIKEYVSKQGYTFQPIDLRWGVSNEAQLDQKTLELCLDEVRSCKSYPHPNFLLMLGDRYGWVPLPYAIESKEFEEILNHVNDAEKEKLLTWYEEDLNQLTVSYILQERINEYEQYDKWVEAENELRDILQNAVELSDGIDTEEKRKYFTSATEAEVIEGILPYFTLTEHQKKLIDENEFISKSTDIEHIFGLFRDIKKSSWKGDKFIVNDEDYIKAQEFKRKVKKELINPLAVSTSQDDNELLDYSYIDEFAEKITGFLKKQIDEQKKLEKKHSITSLEIEKESQKYFAEQKIKNFFETEALRDLLDDVSHYINKDAESEPLVIYGSSGSGKSALMAQSIKEAEERKLKKVIYRFVGATPNSGSSKEILISIFDELGIDISDGVEKEQHLKDDFRLHARDKQETFEEFSYRVYDEINNLDEEVVIFIDAVDQLSNDDIFLWLPSKLKPNVKIIISALSDKKYNDDSKYFKSLKNKISNCYQKPVPKFSAPGKLLCKLLRQDDRTIQKGQLRYLLKQYKRVNTPLYISIASREMKYWKSYDYIKGTQSNIDGKEQNIVSSQQEIIEKFITNLSTIHHHNPKFVNKVLGYIYASRDGLSESELLQLLSTDEAFVKQMAPETWHENPTKELPMVHWSRLYAQLKPFLSFKRQDREELMYFFHREFGDAVSSKEEQKEIHESIILSTQQMIVYYQYDSFYANRWGALYMTLVTEYNLRYKEEQANWIKFSEFIAGLDCEELIEEYLDENDTLGHQYYLYNKMYQAISYSENFLYISRPLYLSNFNKWADYYTRALINLSSSYQGINKDIKAIELQKEGFNILKKLYDENPSKWTNAYTQILDSLSTSYIDINKTTQGIELQKESLNILEKLYAEHPSEWVNSYIRALNSLSVSYAKVNRIMQGIELQEECLNILKKLYINNPRMWAESYTVTLVNLADFYRRVNKLSNAIVLEEKSLDIRKKLYEESPSRWAKRYITVMNNLSMSYVLTNEYIKSIKLLEKSLNILKKQYGEFPNIWAEQYAGALDNLSSSYDKIDNTDEALKFRQKSSDIFKKLYDENFNRWAGEYALGLNNLATSYERNNDFENARKLMKEGVNIFKKLYDENSDKWAEQYSRSLNNLGGFYLDTNNPIKAIELQKESLAIIKELYSQNQDTWIKAYFEPLYSLALSYRDTNEISKAVALENKSLEILEKLCDKNPDGWANHYITVWSKLSTYYMSVNKNIKVIELQKKSLSIFKKLYDLEPDKWANDYSFVLNNVAGVYVNIKEYTAAIKLQEMSLNIRKKLYLKNPDEYAEDYATTLINLMDSYKSINDQLGVIKLESESLVVLKRLYDENPNKWGVYVIMVLDYLATSFFKKRKYSKSINLLNEKCTVCINIYGKGHKEVEIVKKNIEDVKNNWMNQFYAFLDKKQKDGIKVDWHDSERMKELFIEFESFDFISKPPNSA